MSENLQKLVGVAVMAVLVVVGVVVSSGDDTDFSRNRSFDAAPSTFAGADRVKEADCCDQTLTAVISALEGISSLQKQLSDLALAVEQVASGESEPAYVHLLEDQCSYQTDSVGSYYSAKMWKCQGGFFPLADFRDAHLNYVNFSGANLERANFAGASLSQAHFDESELWGANFRGAMLNGAHFNGSTLGHTNFSEAMLNGAHFIEAFVDHADFSNANLNYADFTGAKLWYSNFAGADLTEADFTGMGGSKSNFIGAIITFAVNPPSGIKPTIYNVE